MLMLNGCGKKSGIKYECDASVLETEQYSINTESIEFDLPSESVLNEQIASDTEKWIRDFESRVSDTKVFSDELCNMQVRHKLKLNSTNFLSAVTEKYVYINGARGNVWWVPRNYNVIENRFITLNDLFIDDEYKNILNQKMIEMIDENPDLYHDLWEQPSIRDGVKDFFYLEDGKLIIFFQPYELTYYAKGVIEFPIEAESLRGYLKEEYLKMLVK